MSSPETVVQRQLDAYNARDLEALLAIYSRDAEMFEHPSTLLACGSDALRQRFAQRFAEPNLHAALLHRIVAGNFVIDHERINRTFPDGTGTMELVMIYQVAGDHIINAWSIPGQRTPTVPS